MSELIQTQSKQQTKHQTTKNTYISIELANKAGEIIMLKISGQETLRKLERFDNNKAVIGNSPTNESIKR